MSKSLLYTFLNTGKYSFILVFCIFFICLKAQEKSIIQFSGMVFSEMGREEQPLAFVGLGILRTRHGTFSDQNGFFSMVAESGDTIQISYLGYKSQRLIIPNELNNDRYFKKIYLAQDTFQLESAIVFSIPSKEHFRLEFLEMDVSDKLRDIAEKNLSQDALKRLEPFTPSDGRAGMSLYFSEKAAEAYYDGQIKPQRIFDPLAWAEFFKAWKRGDFKKKKK